MPFDEHMILMIAVMAPFGIGGALMFRAAYRSYERASRHHDETMKRIAENREWIANRTGGV